MAQGNGSDGLQTSSNTGRSMVQKIGDMAQFWKKPEDLSKLPGGGNGQEQNEQQQQQRQQSGNGQGKQPAGGTNAGATNDPETMENPLDVYADIFSDKPKLDKDGKAIEVPQAPRFALDPKTIQDAAGKIDFMAGLPEEVSAKLRSGNIDAETLQAVMQHTGQSAYARAMEHASTLTDRYVGMRLSHEQQGLQGQVQKLLAKSHVLSSSAIRNNPALKEHYEFVSDRLSTKHPDQTPEWIAQKTESYFTDIAKAVNPQFGEGKQQQQDGTTADGATVKDGKVFDWQNYLK